MEDFSSCKCIECNHATGTAADVNTAYGSSGISNLGDEAVTLSDMTLAASVLAILDGNTIGATDATTVTTLTGTAADANAAYGSLVSATLVMKRNVE